VGFEHYIGVDALAEVVEFAKARQLPRCEFHVGDVLAQAEVMSTGRLDVVCISGTLNTMLDAQVFAVLEGAWRSAREALVFNFLSDRCGPGAPPQDTFSRRLNTLRLIEWATARTWAVAFRQDYFRDGHDATIVMRKPEGVKASGLR
jgi:hypothetical protein